jgi:drug/metabolite transporter (DMT)-like permease
LLLWITTLVLSPVVFVTEYHIGRQGAFLLVLTGIMHSTIAPLLYYSALRKVMAQHAAILGYMEPLAAIPLAFFFLSETPAPLALAGGVLILFSGYLVIHARPPEGTEATSK